MALIGRLTELNNILNTMDIPQQRRLDFGWLRRNLGIRNSEKPDFKRAIAIIIEIERENRRLGQRFPK
jgi:hypothetical protein